MPCVNYVKEHIAFIEYAADNGLSSSERLVWYALLHIMNQRANGANWPDGFIRIKNDRILTYAPLGFDAMAKARNSLQQRGLLSYKRGNRNTDTPMYELHYLTVAEDPQLHDGPDDPAVYPSRYPTKTDNKGGNRGGNVRGNQQGSAQGKQGGQYIKHKQGETETELSFDDEDAVDAANRARARAERAASDEFDEYDDDGLITRQKEATEAVKCGMKQYFGREAMPAEAASLGRMAANMGFSDEMIMLALHNSAAEGAKNPVGYCLTILRDWYFEAVTTPEEYGEYSFMADARDGRGYAGMHRSDDIFAQMEQARKDRRAKHEAARGGRLTWL